MTKEELIYKGTMVLETFIANLVAFDLELIITVNGDFILKDNENGNMTILKKEEAIEKYKTLQLLRRK